MTKTILVGRPLRPRLDAALRERYRVLGPVTAVPVAAMPAEQRAGVRAYVTMGAIGTTREEMALLPDLGLICCIGSGFEKVDLAAAAARGIAVAHSLDANAASVADHAMALLLASIRRLPDAMSFVRDGGWDPASGRRLPQVRGLTGRRVGILGLGEIGGRIARRAEAFETEVGYCNRRRKPDCPYPWFPDAVALASWADVLIVAARADESNRRLVGREVLEALGPLGHLVNVSRGSIVDEDALIEALAAGTIAGAGLDVFENEPKVRPDLLAAPNLVATPHCAGSTEEAQWAMAEAVLANLEAYFTTGRPRHPVPAADEVTEAAAS